jgi:hypothetical protein
MKFVQKLSRDEQQCFRSAGLLEELHTAEIREWWDHVTANLRFAADQEKLKRARKAEQRSFDHETERLKQLGIPREPIWMSIDDNTAGYDILSYDVGAREPITRLVEVKSTIASPLRFVLTRNEWETALKFGSRYFFHVWDMQTGLLYERTAAEITPHIPTDNANGRWSNAIVPVGGNS